MLNTRVPLLVGTNAVVFIAMLCMALPSVGHVRNDTERLKRLAGLFDRANVIGEPKAVPCKLSGGSEPTCMSIIQSDGMICLDDLRRRRQRVLDHFDTVRSCRHGLMLQSGLLCP